MRWERLFAELESAAVDDAALERDALADDLVDEEWAAATTRDLLWGDVDLDVQGAGQVSGVVVRALPDVVVVLTTHGDVAVARTAVTGWSGGSGRAPELTEVTRRWGWARLLRSLRDEGDLVHVVRTDGSQVQGRVGAVAADAARIENTVGDVWVPWAAIATVSSLADQGGWPGGGYR